MQKLRNLLFIIGFMGCMEGHATKIASTTASLSQVKLLIAQLTPTQVVDVDLIARTAYGEARGENSMKALESIAHVILNRVSDKKGKWAKSVSKVILQKHQFSCWNKRDPNYEVITTASLNDPEFRKSYLATLKAIKSKDFTRGANHYHTVSVTPKLSSNNGIVRVAQIHKHVFYRA